MRGGPNSFHPRTNMSSEKGISINWYRYQWKGQTNLNAATAALSSPIRAVSAAVDAAVASCASPNAEKPTAKTDRVRNAMRATIAILAFIGLASKSVADYPISFAQFYTGPPSIATGGNRRPQHVRLEVEDECSGARRARISGSRLADRSINAVPQSSQRRQCSGLAQRGGVSGGIQPRVGRGAGPAGTGRCPPAYTARR